MSRLPIGCCGTNEVVSYGVRVVSRLHIGCCSVVGLSNVYGVVLNAEHGLSIFLLAVVVCRGVAKMGLNTTREKGPRK